MTRIRKCALLLMISALMFCLSGCGRNGAEQMVIPIGELTGEPQFYDWDQNGTAMQIIALKRGAEDVQIAYNTCQSCAGSPYAYFEYQNGVLVCQNCLNQFGLDSVGKVAGGCNPMPVTDYRVESDQVVISAEELTKTAPSFRSWKVIR